MRGRPIVREFRNLNRTDSVSLDNHSGAACVMLAFCHGVARARPGLYLPACCEFLMGLTGGFMGTKRVSLLPGFGALDARKMASNRNMKISDSMVVLPGRDPVPRG